MGSEDERLETALVAAKRTSSDGDNEAALEECVTALTATGADASGPVRAAVFQWMGSMEVQQGMAKQHHATVRRGIAYLKEAAGLLQNQLSSEENGGDAARLSSDVLISIATASRGIGEPEAALLYHRRAVATLKEKKGGDDASFEAALEQFERDQLQREADVSSRGRSKGESRAEKIVGVSQGDAELSTATEDFQKGRQLIESKEFDKAEVSLITATRQLRQLKALEPHSEETAVLFRRSLTTLATCHYCMSQICDRGSEEFMDLNEIALSLFEEVSGLIAAESVLDASAAASALFNLGSTATNLKMPLKAIKEFIASRDAKARAKSQSTASLDENISQVIRRLEQRVEPEEPVPGIKADSREPLVHLTDGSPQLQRIRDATDVPPESSAVLARRLLLDEEQEATAPKTALEADEEVERPAEFVASLEALELAARDAFAREFAATAAILFSNASILCELDEQDLRRELIDEQEAVMNGLARLCVAEEESFIRMVIIYEAYGQLSDLEHSVNLQLECAWSHLSLTIDERLGITPLEEMAGRSALISDEESSRAEMKSREETSRSAAASPAKAQPPTNADRAAKLEALKAKRAQEKQQAASSEGAEAPPQADSAEVRKAKMAALKAKRELFDTEKTAREDVHQEESQERNGLASEEGIGFMASYERVSRTNIENASLRELSKMLAEAAESRGRLLGESQLRRLSAIYEEAQASSLETNEGVDRNSIEVMALASLESVREAFDDIASLTEDETQKRQTIISQETEARGFISNEVHRSDSLHGLLREEEHPRRELTCLYERNRLSAINELSLRKLIELSADAGSRELLLSFVLEGAAALEVDHSKKIPEFISEWLSIGHHSIAEHLQSQHALVMRELAERIVGLTEECESWTNLTAAASGDGASQKLLSDESSQRKSIVASMNSSVAEGLDVLHTAMREDLCEREYIQRKEILSDHSAGSMELDAISCLLSSTLVLQSKLIEATDLSEGELRSFIATWQAAELDSLQRMALLEAAEMAAREEVLADEESTHAGHIKLLESLTTSRNLFELESEVDELRDSVTTEEGWARIMLESSVVRSSVLAECALGTQQLFEHGCMLQMFHRLHEGLTTLNWISSAWFIQHHELFLIDQNAQFRLLRSELDSRWGCINDEANQWIALNQQFASSFDITTIVAEERSARQHLEGPVSFAEVTLAIQLDKCCTIAEPLERYAIESSGAKSMQEIERFAAEVEERRVRDDLYEFSVKLHVTWMEEFDTRTAIMVDHRQLLESIRNDFDTQSMHFAIRDIFEVSNRQQLTVLGASADLSYRLLWDEELAGFLDLLAACCDGHEAIARDVLLADEHGEFCSLVADMLPQEEALHRKEDAMLEIYSLELEELVQRSQLLIAAIDSRELVLMEVEFGEVLELKDTVAASEVFERCFIEKQFICDFFTVFRTSTLVEFLVRGETIMRGQRFNIPQARDRSAIEMEWRDGVRQILRANSVLMPTVMQRQRAIGRTVSLVGFERDNIDGMSSKMERRKSHRHLAAIAAAESIAIDEAMATELISPTNSERSSPKVLSRVGSVAVLPPIVDGAEVYVEQREFKTKEKASEAGVWDKVSHLETHERFQRHVINERAMKEIRNIAADALLELFVDAVESNMEESCEAIAMAMLTDAPMMLMMA